jgi:hypothetical protein
MPPAVTENVRPYAAGTTCARADKLPAAQKPDKNNRAAINFIFTLYIQSL